MYEEQIEGLAELILDLMPDRTHANMISSWIAGTIHDVTFAERKRAKEIILSCIHGKLP